ncbi:hypothetical protein BC831DRAFT_512604 [Entophlyctis helioformis]|nr:hypothetical protein BC831DRAFT_512604 [Entophlyctis helioformis]
MPRTHRLPSPSSRSASATHTGAGAGTGTGTSTSGTSPVAAPAGLAASVQVRHSAHGPLSPSAAPAYSHPHAHTHQDLGLQLHPQPRTQPRPHAWPASVHMLNDPQSAPSDAGKFAQPGTSCAINPISSPAASASMQRGRRPSVPASPDTTSPATTTHTTTHTTTTHTTRATPPVADQYSARTFDCTICPPSAASMFVTKLDLIDHVRLTHARKSAFFICEVCGRTLSTQSNLTVHMQVHRTERVPEHKCNMCPMAYFHRSALHRHQRKEHKMSLRRRGRKMSVTMVHPVYDAGRVASMPQRGPSPSAVDMDQPASTLGLTFDDHTQHARSHTASSFGSSVSSPVSSASSLAMDMRADPAVPVGGHHHNYHYHHNAARDCHVHNHSHSHRTHAAATTIPASEPDTPLDLLLNAACMQQQQQQKPYPHSQSQRIVQLPSLRSVLRSIGLSMAADTTVDTAAVTATVATTTTDTDVVLPPLRAGAWYPGHTYTSY